MGVLLWEEIFMDKKREPILPEQFEEDASNSDITRRDFVRTAGVITGVVALGLPVSAYSEQLTAEPFISLLKLEVNGSPQTVSVDPRLSLLDLLRENLGMTGTKKGCDHGQCGACTVIVNGRRINSCLSLAVMHEGDQITTIEGIAQGDQLHPVQIAFLEHDGFQCGYCTPGQICSAVALLEEARRGCASAVTGDLKATGTVNLTAEEIKERMSGNICRCGAYPGIVAAVQSVSKPA
jgi:xanthine dehydrogenase YagT iron-sulfur-binding subunit